ncbi:hypothetical protein PIIN_02988 [Serendipita indica DSM 11827]|uniref:Uncharacterized protein n=1 Tax=Serendipita indica (strain DSM 11827) TaxID=1109443 RepID=G4U2E5_SERID|nr:hypothetical protein PIIN_02988 [Serendipita indica DSM 11827]
MPLRPNRPKYTRDELRGKLALLHNDDMDKYPHVKPDARKFFDVLTKRVYGEGERHARLTCLVQIFEQHYKKLTSNEQYKFREVILDDLMGEECELLIVPTPLSVD